MSHDTPTTEKCEYDTMRGIVIRVPPRNSNASPAARRDAQVTVTAEDGGRITLRLRDVPHLVQALEWMLADESKVSR